eukprot:TRINITY_DN6867_c0_g1_i1.p1 TRINITY_DN6867_c0_g1~~TRINITY_DN6867_c0_g1_i1.p1  ORF type:complete len:106 (-),score=2.39 TRINITY_DN6867_c0_g1_i1:402-719(-)
MLQNIILLSCKTYAESQERTSFLETAKDSYNLLEISLAISRFWRPHTLSISSLAYCEGPVWDIMEPMLKKAFEKSRLALRNDPSDSIGRLRSTNFTTNHTRVSST